MSNPVFSSSAFKRQARESLRGHWPTAILITLIFFVLQGLIVWVSFSSFDAHYFAETMRALQTQDYMALQNLQNAQPHVDPMLSTVTQLISFLLQLLIGGVYTIAAYRWALDLVEGKEATFGDFASHFQLAGRGILTYIWRYIWLTLWGIPFQILIMLLSIGAAAGFIKGAGSDQGMNTMAVVFLAAIALVVIAYLVVMIYKSLSYSFVFFSASDHPTEIGIRRALRISIEATQGYRWALFLLALSFIGWMILSSLLILPFFYLLPYMLVTWAHAYAHLRNKGFDEGLFDAREFGMVPVANAPVVPPTAPEVLPEEPTTDLPTDVETPQKDTLDQ